MLQKLDRNAEESQKNWELGNIKLAIYTAMSGYKALPRVTVEKCNVSCLAVQSICVYYIGLFLVQSH